MNRGRSGYSAPGNSCNNFCSKGDQINRVVLGRGVGEWEGFLQGDITTCLCDDGMDQVEERIDGSGSTGDNCRCHILLVRGEGSGVFLCRHWPPKGAVCLSEGREGGERLNTLVQEGWRARGWVGSVW